MLRMLDTSSKHEAWAVVYNLSGCPPGQRLDLCTLLMYICPETSLTVACHSMPCTELQNAASFVRWTCNGQSVGTLRSNLRGPKPPARPLAPFSCCERFPKPARLSMCALAGKGNEAATAAACWGVSPPLAPPKNWCPRCCMPAFPKEPKCQLMHLPSTTFIFWHMRQGAQESGVPCNLPDDRLVQQFRL